MFAEALMKMRECDSAWALSDLIWPLRVAIYIRKLAISEMKLLEHVTLIVVLWEIRELSLLRVWALIAPEVPPGRLLPYETEDLLIMVQEVISVISVISEVLTGVFPLSHREKPL